MVGNAVVVNFSGGETSPRSRGRFDQPWYQTSAKKLLNFIAELQGPARFRPGFVYVRQTRAGLAARMFVFQISDNLTYELEFTPGYMRAYLNTDLVVTAAQTITGITQASPAVMTCAAITGMANGTEVVLNGIVGMPQLNGRQVTLAGHSGNTFQLKDSVTGLSIDTTGLSAYASGGTAAPVYEITAPYQSDDLASMQFASSGKLGYVVHPKYVPYKLTVDATSKFTLATYSRTNDPFAAAQAAVTITDLRPSFEGDKRLEAAATLTPAAVTGTGINFTASAAAFTSADVGKYIELVTRAGTTRYGRALITAFTSTTVVVCTVITDFDGTGAITSGDWRVVTVGTIVKLANSSVVNSTLTYTITAVGGATQVNGNSYRLVPYDFPETTTAPRFILRSSSDVDVDSSAWGTYTSGGLATPTASQPALTITGITLGATATVIAFTAGDVVNENVAYVFSGISGTTQLNAQTYYLKVVHFYTVDGGGTAIHLVTSSGAEVDSSAWTAWSSGGIATVGAECPLTVGFYEGRLGFFGTNQRPDCLFLSRSPDSSGNSRYDDFTGGTNADHACFFQLAPVNGVSAYASWLRGGPDYLFAGTFGGPYRISGSGLDIPITPSSINVRQFDTAGCEETVPAGLAQIFFVQRAGKTVRSIKVINPYLATFESADMCLNAEQIGYSAIQRVVLQHGRPDVLWVFCADGTLAGMSVHLTVQTADTLTGWHRHKVGGGGKVVDLIAVPQQTGFDQLWAVVQRTVDGVQRCYVEILADDVIFPDPEAFFTGDEDADLTAWKNVVWRLQSNYVHMDAQASYDGSIRGVSVSATLTPSAVGVPQVEGQAATSITLTASAAVFAASDVGSEIWVKPNSITGIGAGRALITAYVSTTQVTATVSVAFTDTSAIPAGDWYFAISTFYGFGHLEGVNVAVLADGAVVTDGGQTEEEDYPTITIEDGTLTLPQGNLGIGQRAAVMRAGFPYIGIIETHNLEMGGRSGPAQAKARNISEINARFMSTLGAEYGTDLYKLDKIDHRLSDAIADRPAPVFSGIKRITLNDQWSGLDDATREKNVMVCQRLPLPAVVQFLDVTYDTADEGGPR